MLLSDTIAAIATPAGRGGLGIIRISGSDSVGVALRILRIDTALRPRHAHRAALVDAGGSVIDDVLVTHFPAPHSYTGEDVIEVSCHGSPVVLHHAMERVVRSGARFAEPGEFTLRAFVNGRIDLPQAEAVRDLIDATTLHQARVAAQQASGSMARRVRPLKEQLVELIALLEAGIDFAEDDISVAPNQEILRRLEPVAAEIGRLARSYAYGHVLREGFTMAIVGRPNVGKSSLFNRLLEQDRAIVADQPGTTRDAISEATAIEGIPVKLVDTAGIRDGESVVESLGIERSFTAMADADLTLVVVDSSQPAEARDQELIVRAREQGRFLVAANKCDLGKHDSADAVFVSAATGEGIARLRRAIVQAVAPEGAVEQEGNIVTSLRQHNLLREAQDAFKNACSAIENTIPHEMLLLDLYTALAALDGITGRTTADDILNRIFSTFCIGK